MTEADTARRPPPAAVAAALVVIDACCTVGAWVAAGSAGLLAAMLILEVIVTSFFSWSQAWVVEYSMFLLAFVLFCGSGWTLRQGGHIRVSVLLQALPRRLAFATDVLASALTIGVLAFASQALWPQALRSLEFGSTASFPMATPLWIPQVLLAVGVTLLTLAFIARLTRLLLGQAPDLGGGGLGASGHE